MRDTQRVLLAIEALASIAALGTPNLSKAYLKNKTKQELITTITNDINLARAILNEILEKDNVFKELR